MERQVIIARQLIEAGADVNALNGPALGKNSPLHNACFSGRCTNLDLIKLFLDHPLCRNTYIEPYRHWRYFGKVRLYYSVLGQGW